MARSAPGVARRPADDTGESLGTHPAETTAGGVLDLQTPPAHAASSAAAPYAPSASAM